jgi:nitrate reductase gamma subunit
MNAVISLVAVLALVGLAIVGVEAAGLHILFGAVFPYIAIGLFLFGLIYRVIGWAKSPVPFRIPTTCGQQKTLPWIKSDNLDNPHNLWGVIGRMLLEILFFRSLFRNTRMELKEGDKVVYGPTKWLWLAGLAFHWSFLIIFIRHLRFFTEPVPFFVDLLQNVDGFFQIGVPELYATSLVLLAAVTYLVLRRLWVPQLRYISLVNDFFPLFLILAIGTTGFLLRHFVKTDIVGIKELGMGLLSFSPVASDQIHYLFYTHLFLVSMLIAYFPFSKLMHMAGVFMSPTRNLANNNRAVRHVNPWDYPVKVHTYEEYEDDFRDKMIAAGIPVDKQPEPKGKGEDKEGKE